MSERVKPDSDFSVLVFVLVLVVIFVFGLVLLQHEGWTQNLQRRVGQLEERVK